MSELSQTSPATPHPLAPRDGLIIALVGVAHFSSHFFQLSLAAVFPLLREAFNVNYATLGAVATTFYLTSGIAQAFAGIVVDRFGARPMLLIGIATMATSIAAYGMIDQFWMFYPLAVLAGLGNSVFHPADFSLLSSRVSPARMGRAFGVHAFCGTIGFASAPLVVGGLAYLFDWRTALIAAGIFGWIVVALLMRFSRELGSDGETARAPAVAPGRGGGHGGAAPADATPVKFSYAKLITTPAIVMAFSYFLLTAAAGSGYQTFGASSLVEIYGVTASVAVTALTAFMVAQAVGILTGGVLADRTDRHALIAGCGLATASMLMLTVASGILSFNGVLAVVTLAGLSQGLTAPSRDILVRAATPKGATGKVFGFVYSGLDAGSTIAPLMFGLLLDHHMTRWVFVMIAVFYGLAVLSALTVARQGAANKAPV